jgi:uncharacterized protein (TIGR02246 family)
MPVFRGVPGRPLLSAFLPRAAHNGMGNLDPDLPFTIAMRGILRYDTCLGRDGGSGMRFLPVLAVAATVGCSPVATSQEDSDEREVTKVRDAIIEAYNTQDIDGMMEHFHPDVGYLVPSRPYVQGRDAVRAMYEQAFARFGEANSCAYLSPIRAETVVAGDWAWVRGESRFMRAGCGAAPREIHDLVPGSKHLGIYKKENGRWLRYRQMRNGNTPEMNI